MSDLTKHTCPKCGARLTLERVDHHLSGNEKLICPEHGTVGCLDDNRGRVDGRHRVELGENDD